MITRTDTQNSKTWLTDNDFDEDDDDENDDAGWWQRWGHFGEGRMNVIDLAKDGGVYDDVAFILLNMKYYKIK